MPGWRHPRPWLRITRTGDPGAPVSPQAGLMKATFSPLGRR